MSYPVTLSQIPNDLAEEIDDELFRARRKFPEGSKLLAALGEEFGELCAALTRREGPGRVREEAIQVCAMAIRIITEGEKDYPYDGDWNNDR